MFDSGGDGRGGGTPTPPWLAVLRRWRWMLAVAALTAGVAAYVSAASGERSYDAKAVLLVGPYSSTIDTLRAAGNIAQTYAELATSRTVLDVTERRLRIPGVGSQIRASASQVTRLLTIEARDVDPVMAARIANAHAQTLRNKIYSKPPRDGGPGQVQIIDPAEPERAAVGPGAGVIAILAALVGLLGAVGLALLLDRSSESVSSADGLKAATGVSFLGALDKEAARRDRMGRSIFEVAPRSRAADQVRLLAAKLTAMGVRNLLVLSMEDDGGAVASNLAEALRAGGARVALVDADEGSPPADDGAGWNWNRQLLAKVRGDKDGSSGDEPVTGVEVLPAVSSPSSASSVENAQRLLAELSADHDFVVVFARPLGRSVSALVWGRLAEGTVLVAQRDRTSSDELRAAIESLELVQARFLGTVLTTPSATPWS